MVLFPNCKINLGLRVIRKRPDGYHDLETVFYPLDIKDALEIVPAKTLSFTATGIPIPGDETSNLCYKAYHLLKQLHPSLPPVGIHLHKHIPMGAGMGGGSSDGAFMLMGLNKQFHLGLSEAELIDHAAALGSDCPFFILNKPAIGGGRGEQLTPIDLDLSRYSFLVVNPGVHISTAWAFSQIRPSLAFPSVREVIAQPVESWAAELINDFEEPVFKAYPELADIKQRLYDAGAVYAAMTGSGSSFFAIVEKGFRLSPTFMPDQPVITLT